MLTKSVGVVVSIVCLAGCLPTKDRLVSCHNNTDCDRGFECDLGTNTCVCDGTTTHSGCAKVTDAARPVAAEVMPSSDTDGPERDLSRDGIPDEDIDAAVPPTPDAAPDTSPPDTQPIECTTSAQCQTPTPICTANTCTACTDASQCLARDPKAPACATNGPLTGQCVQCTDDSPCRSMTATPVCSIAKNECVECTSNTQCLGTARVCELSKNRCVDCTDHTTCSGTTPICELAIKKCTACTSAGQCQAKDPKNPACVTTGSAAGQCVQCTDDSSCKSSLAAPACNTIKNKCVECIGHGNCPPTSPICELTSNQCRKCASASDCTGLGDPKRAVCAPAGTCVQCTKNTECSGDTPLCDLSTNKCVPCTTSTMCAALSNTKRAVCSSAGACVECIDNTTCGGLTPICDTMIKRCVPCTASPQCAALSDAKRAVCSSAGACVECTASTNCTGSTPICNTGTNKCAACSTSNECESLGDANRAYCGTTGACVQCTSGTHCSEVAGTSTPYCEPLSLTCVECLASTDCSGKKPICSSNLCRACRADLECSARDTSTKACATSGTVAGQCVPCTGNSHCGGGTPICETSTNTCRACTGDQECAGIGPGVCMKHQDGRCATAEESLVITNAASLPASFPAGKRLIIIRGTVTGTVTWTLPSSQVTIIGQSHGVLTGNGTTATMHLTGGDFTMRDLSLTGGSPGLWAAGGAIARLDHVSVSNNNAGGILIDGAGFDIRNTTINGNGANTAGAAAFGGIRIQSPLASPRVFTFSTVTENQLLGVSCDAGNSLNPLPTTILVSQTSGVPIATVCGFTSCGGASASCGAQ